MHKRSSSCFLIGRLMLWLPLWWCCCGGWWCDFSCAFAFRHPSSVVSCCLVDDGSSYYFARRGRTSGRPQALPPSSVRLRSVGSHQQDQKQHQFVPWCDDTISVSRERDPVVRRRQRRDAILAHVDALLSSEQPEELMQPTMLMMPVEDLVAADLATAQDSCLALEEPPPQRGADRIVGKSPPPYEWIHAEYDGDDDDDDDDDSDGTAALDMMESGSSSSSTKQQEPPQSQSQSQSASNKKKKKRRHCYYPLAVRSCQEQPLLDAEAVTCIRRAAERVWSDAAASSSSASSSRFTYQYPGNSEAHVFDFSGGESGGGGEAAVAALNEALQSQIYPLIRSAFLESGSSGGNQTNNATSDTATATLFVYDALVIRYNATAAAAASASASSTMAAAAAAAAGAGQPLHRDRGFVTVNIMLNDHNEAAAAGADDSFRGGGTFFENQLRGRRVPVAPLRPRGPGHCLAHLAAERHAGAGTVAGVRDILVLFVSSHSSSAVRAALLKQCRAHCSAGGGSGGSSSCQQPQPDEERRRSLLSSVLCRIRHQRWAVQESNYQDGEAFQYLGTALMEYADLLLAVAPNGDGVDPDQQQQQQQQQQSSLQAALHCFQCAASLTPCDARVYNNWGIVLGKLQAITHGENENENDWQKRLVLQREQVYQRALDLLRWSRDAGCNVAQDLDSLSLNYGLFLANQDRYRAACEVLQPTASKHSNDGGGGGGGGGASTASSKTIRDAHRLWKWCKEQLR